MSALKSTLTVFLLICFLSCSVSEDQQLQLIAVRPGDDVTLPCRAPNNVTIAAVKWSRSNLDRYVYLKSDGHLNTADQDPSYVNRVQLKDDEMKNGDLSLILKKVNNKDKGTYECRYMERGGRWERAGDQIKLIVYLKVKDPPITAQPGQTVTLPCRAPNNVTIASVEWNRSDLKRHIYFQSDGHLNTADQDPSYVNRVQLEDDEMKNGELSLILKKVNNNDGGTYVCRYVEETGRRRKRSDQSKLIRTVYLDVEDGDAEGGKDKHQHLGVILPVSLIAALVVVGLVGFMIFKKLKGRSENNPDLPVDDPDVLQQLQENENSQKNITHNISDTQV